MEEQRREDEWGPMVLKQDVKMGILTRAPRYKYKTPTGALDQEKHVQSRYWEPIRAPQSPVQW